jgi:glycosyltransferase involved in cell wall biosynthesis
MNKIKSVSVVIPALNEERAIGWVIKQIPVVELNKQGYDVEIVVVDNGSEDATADIARSHGARVVRQPIRGYGNAYKKGFIEAKGEVIVTGDGDMTYPFEVIPEIIERIEAGYDFINTDRLTNLKPGVMKITNLVGNRLLTWVVKLIYKCPYSDSQSGMWVFRRSIWPKLDVNSDGMSFSQEIKIEAHMRGFNCAEVCIDYRARAGETKLRIVKDGLENIYHLIKMRKKYSKPK